MDPLLWVVVPCYREQQLSWLVQQYKRQAYKRKRLCVVENGDAIGACRRNNVDADLIVASRPHVSHARNEGMFAVRDVHDGWLCMWDDDDWYGPSYLSEAAELVQSNKADIYGKQRHFAAIPGNGLFLFNEVSQNKLVDWVHGPSLIFRAADGVAFRVQKEAEEMRWCHDMQRMGARIWSSSIHHLLYLRYGAEHGHAWKTSDDIVVRASQKNDYFYHLGQVDLDIVTGSKDWRAHVISREGTRTPPPLFFSGKSVPIKVLPTNPQRSAAWSTVRVASM